MSEKQICFMCEGNGFRTVHEDTTKTNVVLINCSNCNSNGEAFILDQEKHDKLKAEFDRGYKDKSPTLEDVVDENSCRYPLGEINDPPKYFCGEIRYANSPYCKVHLVICTSKEKT